MKKFSQVIVATIIITSSYAFAESFSPKHDEVAAIFKSEEEPTTKDAVWTAKNFFKVGVIDNGSSRDGYAAYVCEVLLDHGFESADVTVHVIDIAKLSNTGKWVKIGESDCEQ